MPRLKKTIFGLKAFARRVQAGDDSADLRARLQGPGSRRIVERGLFCLQLGLALNHRIELGREGQRTDPLTQTLGVWAAELFQRLRPDRCHRQIGWDVVATSITTCVGGGSVETELRRWTLDSNFPGVFVSAGLHCAHSAQIQRHADELELGLRLV